MPLKNGRSRWRVEGIRKFRKGWWVGRGRNIHLKRGKYCQLKRLEKETSTKLRIWGDTPKYLCFAKISSINIKSSMTTLWNFLTTHRKLKLTALWCSPNLSPKKFPATTTISNLKWRSRRRNRKNKIWRITPELAERKIMMAWVDQVKIKPLSSRTTTKGWAQPKADRRRNKERWCMIGYHQRNH